MKPVLVGGAELGSALLGSYSEVADPFRLGIGGSCSEVAEPLRFGVDGSGGGLLYLLGVASFEGSLGVKEWERL
jgi:hypothetical protein